MNFVQRSSGQVACQVDLGNERQFEAELADEGALWLTTGPGIDAVDLWINSVVPDLDLRVNVRRTRTGVEILIDRGQQDKPWWPGGHGPRLTIAVDPADQTVSASAGLGAGTSGVDVLLGRISSQPG